MTALPSVRAWLLRTSSLLVPRAEMLAAGSKQVGWGCEQEAAFSFLSSWVGETWQPRLEERCIWQYQHVFGGGLWWLLCCWQ